MRVKKTLGGLRVKASTLNEEERSLSAVISSDRIDRDGEVVLPKAFTQRLSKDGYPLLWMHDPTRPPIGKVTDVEIGTKSIDARIAFRAQGENALADDVFSCFKSGHLNSFSIGFQVHDYEMRDVAGKSKKVAHVTDAELLEVSAVNIPANPDALAKAFQLTNMEPEVITKWKEIELLDDEVLRKALKLIGEAKGMDVVPKEISGLIEEIRLAVLQPRGAQGDGGDEGTAKTLEALRGLSWGE